MTNPHEWNETFEFLIDRDDADYEYYDFGEDYDYNDELDCS